MIALDYASCLKQVSVTSLHTGGVCSCCKDDSTKDLGETIVEEDKFIEEELVLAALLLLNWNLAIAGTELEEVLAKGLKNNNSGQLNAALEKANYWVDTAYEDYGQPVEIKSTLEKTMLVGLLIYGSSTVWGAINKSRKKVIGGLEKQTAFWMNNYFRRIVHPAILSAVSSNVTGLVVTDYAAATAQAIKLGLFNTASYWRTVANVQVSRAHHYGVLRGAQYRRMRGYRWVSVLDKRTTPYCRSMNGREFWVSNGVNFLEQLSEMNGEQAREFAPWPPSNTDPASMSERDLVLAGWHLPPVHANCRSTVRATYR